MANTKISELPIATTTNGTDVVPIVQEGTTKQVNVGTLVNGNLPQIATEINSSSTNDEVAGAKAVYDLTSVVEDITDQITYTKASGMTISAFNVKRVGGIMIINFTATYTSTSSKFFDIMTLTNISELATTSGFGRTYDQPAGTTVHVAGFQISGSTGLIQAFTEAQSRGAIGTIIIPAVTITNTSRTVNLLKSTEKTEEEIEREIKGETLEKTQNVEETKQEEIKEETELEELTKANNETSGDTIEEKEVEA